MGGETVGGGKERPHLTAAARQAIEDALASGCNVAIRLSAEGKFVVEVMSRKIIYRAP